MAIKFRKPAIATSKPPKPSSGGKPPKTPNAPSAPTRPTRPSMMAGAGLLGAGVAIPALTASLPFITQIGNTAIMADALPETINAVGEAVSEVLQSNPTVAFALVGVVGFAVYKAIR